MLLNYSWQKVLNPEVIKGYWTKEEDKLLVELVGKLGSKQWSQVAKHLPGRIGKQCRERYHNHLDPDLRKDRWTDEEESILLKMQEEFGNR